MLEKDVQLYRQFQTDPFLFIEYIWGLRPQKKREKFIKGRHITRQQSQIVEAVQDAVRGEGFNMISIASGHGIGKSSILAMLIIWYLFCFKDAQIPCTAPTQTQMYDVLWKELAKWIDKMPKELGSLFDLQGDYLRIVERPKTWFARAKTGKKENAEALAGVHSDYVMLIADEASGVPDEIFESSKGALTNKNVLFIMISNPTRLEGYFYNSHHSLKHLFRCLQFNSEESPIVEQSFIDNIIEENGLESDQYRIRVKGLFPQEGTIDDKGYSPLLLLDQLVFTQTIPKPTRLGVDPSGEGNDETIGVERDTFVAKIAFKEKVSKEKGIAEKISTWSVVAQRAGKDIFIDNFGVGANVGVELALSGMRANCVNVGTPATRDLYLNKRAECFWRLRDWILKGGQLYGTIADWKDILLIKFKRNLQGKIQIMSKEDIRKLYGKSPDTADALSLTFYNEEVKQSELPQTRTYRDPWTGEIKKIPLQNSQRTILAK